MHLSYKENDVGANPTRATTSPAARYRQVALVAANFYVRLVKQEIARVYETRVPGPSPGLDSSLCFFGEMQIISRFEREVVGWIPTGNSSLVNEQSRRKPRKFRPSQVSVPWKLRAAKADG